ncbi:MAG: hypothetical protein HY342_04510 [Candidatus Lambdaproteobacteria bacterium]|nr:hypothetical protein [Candidatus Lambdaproteobacteria bacterium]
MLRVGSLLCLFLLLAAQALLAQVAAPSLLPLNPMLAVNNDVDTDGPEIGAGFVTLNPAAMQWSGYSLIGAGGLEGSEKREGADPIDQNSTGSFYGVRGVWEYLSLAAEGVNFESGKSAARITMDTVNVALAGQAWDWIALGASQSNITARFTSGGVTLGKFDSVINTVGTSLRIGEYFYVGAASGEEFLHAPEEAVRPVKSYGVAFRNEGELRMHLEYYKNDKDPLDFGNGPDSEEHSGTGVLELGWGSFVLGYRLFDRDRDEAGVNKKFVGATASVGWVSQSGLAILLHGHRGTSTQGAGSDPLNNEYQAVSVAWAF